MAAVRLHTDITPIAYMASLTDRTTAPLINNFLIYRKVYLGLLVRRWIG